MRFQGLLIDLPRLAAVREATARRVSRVAVGGTGATARVVTEEGLAETRERHPKCRCEERGLHAGMPVEELIDLEEGCTEPGDGSGWVCERLNTIRRRYGK